MYVWNRGYCRVEVQSDSHNAIQCIFMINVRKGGSTFVIIVQELLRKDWEVQVSYVSREFNTVANKLASFMCGQLVEEVVFKELSDLVCDVVVMEALLEHNLREDPGG
ncbi:hypothetical protein V6N13_046628 [Hibiscus sabdariffa]